MDLPPKPVISNSTSPAPAAAKVTTGTYSANGESNYSVNENRGTAPEKRSQSYNSNLGKYPESINELFEKYDTILDNNLKLLDESFNSSLQFLDYLIDSNEVMLKTESGQLPSMTEDREQNMKGEANSGANQDDAIMTDTTEQSAQKKGEKATDMPQVLHEKFLKILSNSEFRETVLSYNKANLLKTHKMAKHIHTQDLSKNIPVRIYELESKDLPEAHQRLEQKVNEYQIATHENNLGFRNNVVPFENDSPGLGEAAKFPDVPQYSEITLDEDKVANSNLEQINTDDSNSSKEEKQILNKDLTFLDLKNIKSERYLQQLRVIKTEKFKYRIINEALVNEKRALDEENANWQERKSNILKFLNVDLKNINTFITKVNEDLHTEIDKSTENQNVSEKAISNGTDTKNRLEFAN